MMSYDKEGQDTSFRLAKACDQCLATVSLLTSGLRDYLAIVFENEYGQNWSKPLKERLRNKMTQRQVKSLKLHLGVGHLDLSNLIGIFKWTWEPVFSKEAESKALNLAGRCIELCNNVLHQELNSFDDCSRILLHLHEFARSVPSLHAVAEEIQRLIDGIEDITENIDKVEACSTSQAKKKLKANELKLKASQLFNLGRITEAIEFYSRAITMDPVDATLFMDRSVACYSLGEKEPKYYKLAREDAENAIEKDPTQPKYYHFLGSVFEKLELPHDALQAYEDGFKINPCDSELAVALRDCKAKIKIIRKDTRSDVESWKELLESQHQKTGMHMSHEQLIRKASILTSVGNPPLPGSALDFVIRGHKKRDEDNDPQDAAKLYEKAAKMNNAEGMFNLGCLYLHGIGVVRDPGKGLEMLEKAADLEPWLSETAEFRVTNLGVAEAQNSLGVAYRDGNGVDVDNKKAAYWFKKAADNDQVLAQNSLGYCFMHGRGVDLNYDIGRQWYQKAADKELAAAQCNLAEVYDKGLGVPINYELAEKWYQKAADQGYARAIESLARLNCTNKAKDFNTVLEALCKEAESKNPDSLCKLAVKYKDGVDGVAKNLSKAKQLLLEGAKQNHAESQYILGKLFADDLHSQEAAFKWFLRAAENGHIVATVDVALFYSAGRGTPYNAEEASLWAKRAIKRTDHNSIKQLLQHVFECDSKSLGTAEQSQHAEKDKMLDLKRVSWNKRMLQRLKQHVPPEFEKLLVDVKGHSEDERPCSNVKDEGSPIETVTLANPSQTAKRHSKAVEYQKAALAKALCGQDLEAIKLLHQALLLWHPLIWDVFGLQAIKKTIEHVLANNPHNPEAMLCHVLTTFDFQSNIKYLQVCIAHHPLKAEFHEYLGDMLCWADRYGEARQSFTRALELDATKFVRYYCRAAALLYLPQFKEKPSCISIVLCDYQKYLSLAEPDAKNVADAHYEIAEIFMNLGDFNRAKHHYELGKAAESPPRRLAVFGPAKTPSKFYLNRILTVMQQIGRLPRSLQQYPINSSPGLQCFHCLSEKEGMQCCSNCKIAFYCNDKCQKANFSQHKIICKFTNEPCVKERN